MGSKVESKKWESWLRRSGGLATVVEIVALCLAVAVTAIAFSPQSPVSMAIPTGRLSGLDDVGGVVPGVKLARSGTLGLEITDPSLAQRLLVAATLVPGLLLVAEIARRMARLLRFSAGTDPFTTDVAQRLGTVAKITAIGGLGTWVIATAARALLSSVMLSKGVVSVPDRSILGWWAVALIIAAFSQLVARGVALQSELDTFI